MSRNSVPPAPAATRADAVARFNEVEALAKHLFMRQETVTVEEADSIAERAFDLAEAFLRERDWRRRLAIAEEPAEAAR